MAIGDRTYQWAAHTAWGYPFNFLQNAIEHTFGYTANNKVTANGAAAAVLASTTGTTAVQTIVSGITQPDVPRVLAVTLGGSGFSADTVQIVGVNVEGKPITDTITYTTSTGQVVGSLVFKRVTSVILKGSLGASATVTVDTTNKLGLNHRCPPNFSTAIVIHDTADSDTGAYPITKPLVEAAPSSSNFDGQFVEKNWVQPATAPNGVNFQYFFYWFHKVLVYPPKDSPEFYSTTTSTSTSSTSTSTSFSSTSTSISTSSTSTSITTTSTSSTSTSTTTLPV